MFLNEKKEEILAWKFIENEKKKNKLNSQMKRIKNM